MTIYTDLRSTSADLIDKYGTSISVERDTEGSYDPATGTAAETSTTFTSAAVISSFKKSDIDGTNVLLGDLMLLVKASSGGWEPTRKDKVTIDGQEYFVVNFNPIKPGGTDVIYEVQIRK